MNQTALLNRPVTVPPPSPMMPPSKPWFPQRLLPKLVDSLKHYRRQDAIADLIAGLTVGLVALPLAMAFAISSGVKPEAGIYTAIIGGLVVSALGGSRCQISGPTGAFVVIVAGIVVKFGISGLLMCTLMSGVILLLMGITGLGAAVRFIPRPVTIGFTNGIAVLIASTQIKDFFGIQLSQVPSEFAHRMQALFSHAHSFQWVSVGLAVLTVGIILVWPRITRRVPGSIIALMTGTLICLAFGLGVDTIGSRFGGIPSGLPSLQMPPIDLSMFAELLPSAMTVAMLAAIESLLSAVVADSMSGDKHRPDAELVAQGAANLIVPFFGGIPITGAIARTATNIRSGARTPVSGITHGIVLIVILLVAAPLAQHIPLAVLAGILMIVAYNMGEWREIPSILRLSWADRLVWGATFGLTVFADLTIAVEVGMMLAALLYIRQVAGSTAVLPVTSDYLHDGRAHLLQDKIIPPYVTVYRIHGPFLFGATAKLEELIPELPRAGSVIILKLHHMTTIDSTGIHAMETFAEQVHRQGKVLLLCGAQHQPAQLIWRSRLRKIIGRKNILPHIEAALQQATKVHEGFGGVAQHLAQSLSHSPT